MMRLFALVCNYTSTYLAILALSVCILVLTQCENKSDLKKANLSIKSSDNTVVVDSNFIINRANYVDKLSGFWLGQSIANWTGLITEMDKIGNIGEIKTGPFYTRDNWGKEDEPSIWGEGLPSNLSKTINFILADTTEVWGSDDDTDIEYMYQYLMFTNNTTKLSAEQIRDGWLTHISAKEENYLWVSNQQAFDLMQQGMLPPETSEPMNNPHYAMIDAQLTTEIFGLFAPARPDIAREIARLPIRVTAYQEAESIAQFYVSMYALAAVPTPQMNTQEKLLWMANKASKSIPRNTYPAKMFAYVFDLFEQGLSWEEARDLVYQRYQVKQEDGYTISSQNLYCNGCFAAGINFSASLISLFWGKGDLKETIKIGSLCGWDSDNPTATWGGLLGFMLGKNEIENIFGQKLSTTFNIHRTRQNFPNNGLDTFDKMAEKGISIIDRCVVNEMGGKIDKSTNTWIIPMKSL